MKTNHYCTRMKVLKHSKKYANSDDGILYI